MTVKRTAMNEAGKQSGKEIPGRIEAGESFMTTDPKKIRKWAEERGGVPSKVKGTRGEILRINFPGGAEESLENMSWDEFFERMKENNLAILCQERKANGEMSTFFKLVDAETMGKNHI